VATSLVQSNGEPVPPDAEDTSPGGAEVDAYREPEPEPEPDAPSAADIAQQEQDELWSKETARAWHQRRWVRVLIALVVLTGLAAIIPYPLRVTSDCTLIPSERVKVRSEMAGVIIEILVDEGQTVKKGQIIARIDDRALKAERLKVLAEIEKIEAELGTLRKGRRPEEIQQQNAILSARRNEVTFAKKEAKRRRQMVREGVGSRQANEEAQGELETKRRAVAEADAALRLLKAGSRPEEIAAQEAVLKRSRAELAFVDEKLAMTIVRAPIDGDIMTPRFREHLNEGVEAGGLVCEIANTRRMRAEIFMPEREVDVLALGMPAVVKVESYPARPFEGKVDFIAPIVDGKDRRVRVVVELDNADGALKANMTGYGEVEAGKRSLLDLATRRIVRWVRVRFLL
jgi:multidrug efflux pump subunit AcrA (membrane-fusion protein)